MSVLGLLGLRIDLLFWGEIVSFVVFCELPCQANPTISLGSLLGFTLRLGVPSWTIRDWVYNDNSVTCPWPA